MTSKFIRFHPPPAAFWRTYLCPQVLPFLPANVSPVTSSSYGLPCVRVALSEVGSCSRFIVGIFINVFVASCTHLSFARFLRLFTFCFVLSSRFLPSLVSYGFLALTLRHTLLDVCLLFLLLPCCIFSFVASFSFVYRLFAQLELAH